MNNGKFLIHLTYLNQIFIDGPYGAPSSHIFKAQHAVLVGTGIGVTPFASILQSIMHRYWKGELSDEGVLNAMSKI
jgi:predicted ferric reductase